MKTWRDTTSAVIMEDLREQWTAKLLKMEVDLVRQKAALRDRLRMQIGAGQAVEAGQTQLQLRELDKELQRVSERVSDIHKGRDFLLWEE